MERLQKVIANSGYCSRRNAENLILDKKVMVNGKVISELGCKVSPTDVITVEGKIINQQKKEYVLLYKPRGVVTTTKDEHNRKTVLDLIETNIRLYPVGRLDYDTSGLLILTNDGELANLLMHPRNKIDKVYVSKVEGLVTKDQILKLRKGLTIDGFKTALAGARIIKYDKKTDTSIVELTIHEGKNHQVKKMLSAIGHEVIKLKREKVSFLTLKGLKSGEYRYLNIKEVKKLYNEAKNKDSI
ncbi:MAG: rRNA pseudouridine synthase [Firmicutes bacterium]|nr:rRNA pseudouridine synthase [Bacillota bacterium]